MFAARSCWNSAGPIGAGLPKNIKLAVADQPVLRVGLDEIAFGQRHCTKISELRRVANRIGLEKLAMLGAREEVPVLVPFVLNLRQPARGPSGAQIVHRVITLYLHRN